MSHDSETESTPAPDERPETPAAAGYRMPAEWEPHEATWIAWPHNREDWPGKFAPVPWVYTEIVRLLARFEQVHILIKGRARVEKAREQLLAADADLEHVRFFKAATDRVWTRDFGPTFVENDALDLLGVVDWRFNGWAKYDNHRSDRKVAKSIADMLGCRRWTPRADVGGRSRRVVMEGGAIDVNGRGTLLTTEECLLGEIQARNPGLAREAVEKVFADYLGVSRVIWLGQGIQGDDTHGHVDDLARFVSPTTIVTVVESRKSDANYEPLRDNRKRLKSSRDQDGNPLTIETLPMPAPVVFDGQRLPASYANFYVGNRQVLVPTFNDPNDRVALNVLGGLFPDREVVGVHSVDLVLGLGTLHCLTQQQPALPADVSLK